MALPKRLKSTVLALLVLIVPGVCYLLLQTGTNHYDSLPVYGPGGGMALTDSVPDSAWHKVDVSRFAVSGSGMPELEGRMYVAGFLRAQVSGEADTLAINMARVGKTYRDLERLNFITFIATDSATIVTDSAPGVADSAASANDSAPVVGDSVTVIAGSTTGGGGAGETPAEELVKSYTGGGSNWFTVRMPEATMQKVLREEFLLESDLDGESGAPMSNMLVLVDSRRRIRGYYDGSSYFGADTLDGDIAVLWKEEMNQDEER